MEGGGYDNYEQGDRRGEEGRGYISEKRSMSLTWDKEELPSFLKPRLEGNTQICTCSIL